VQRRKRGFTIIELLVVLVLIAILVSLAVTRYHSVRDASLVASATADLDLVRKVLAYYSVDHESFPSVVTSYDDLKNQMVDLEGNPYGRLPISNTYAWVSYTLNSDSNYEIRVQVTDRNRTVLIATPDAVERQ